MRYCNDGSIVIFSLILLLFVSSFSMYVIKDYQAYHVTYQGIIDYYKNETILNIASHKLSANNNVEGVKNKLQFCK